MERFSEMFRDMDEVRAYVESMKPWLSADKYEDLLYLFGFLENRAVSEPVQLQGKVVQIDRFLAPMITDLNQRGIVTMACCSGLQEEHQESKYKPSSGYLSIAYDGDFEDFLKKELTDPSIRVKESECYLKRSIQIEVRRGGDADLKEKWGQVWDAFRLWQAGGS